jgi:proteasome lid subunit RPN8/RPN11
MTLVLPRGLPQALRDDAKKWGSTDVETGAFLLGHCASVDLIAWPGVRDTVRARDQFAVGGFALAQLFDWAEDKQLRVLALVHSHRGRAFLSPVDLKHGFSVPGFVSAIIPHYHDPSVELSDWGWWRFDKKWQPLDPPALDERAFAAVTFDSRGVA